MKRQTQADADARIQYIITKNNQPKRSSSIIAYGKTRRIPIAFQPLIEEWFDISAFAKVNKTDIPPSAKQRIEKELTKITTRLKWKMRHEGYFELVDERGLTYRAYSDLFPFMVRMKKLHVPNPKKKK